MKKQLSFIILFFITLFIFADDLEFVSINGGSIQRKDNFGNVQTVKVDSFKISNSLITVKDWRTFLNEVYPDTINDWQQRMLYLVDSDYSITKVSEKWPAFILTWYQVIEYCNWQSRKDGLIPVYKVKMKDVSLFDIYWDIKANGYRLPTEAEWEVASGISTKTATEKDYLVNSWVTQRIDIQAKPHNIKLKPANKYALYDVIGIVGQYCWDYYSDNYYLSNDVINPKGPSTFFASKSENPNKEIRVVRGGSWVSIASDLVKYPRRYGYVDTNNGMIGFRLAKN